MSSYIIRIELHGSLANYATLHNWMQQQSFKTTVLGGNGLRYKLPTATYQIDSERAVEDLRDWLVAKLPSCGSSPLPWILVALEAGLAWRMGIPLAKAA